MEAPPLAITLENNSPPNVSRPHLMTHPQRAGHVSQPPQHCSVTSLGALASSPCPPGNNPERLGGGAGRKQSSQASRVGAREDPVGHRKGVAGTPGASSWKEGVARWAPPAAGAPHGQRARALGRAGPASGDPGMSFGTEGQALSLITRGSGRRLSHGSLYPRACGNWLLSRSSVGFRIVAPPSATVPELSAELDEEGGEGRWP